MNMKKIFILLALYLVAASSDCDKKKIDPTSFEYFQKNFLDDSKTPRLEWGTTTINLNKSNKWATTTYASGKVGIVNLDSKDEYVLTWSGTSPKTGKLEIVANGGPLKTISLTYLEIDKKGAITFYKDNTFGGFMPFD